MVDTCFVVFIYMYAGGEIIRRRSISAASIVPCTHTAPMTASEDSGHGQQTLEKEKGQSNDVFVQVLAQNIQGLSVSKEEERRLVRKLDRRIMPMLGLMYLFAGNLYRHIHANLFTNLLHTSLSI